MFFCVTGLEIVVSMLDALDKTLLKALVYAVLALFSMLQIRMSQPLFY